MQNDSLCLAPPIVQDNCEQVREHTAAILTLVERESWSMVEIGLRLHDVRNRVGRDGFQPYLTQFFPRSQTLACQLMQVAIHFHSVEPEILGRFHRGALILLSRDRSPEEARAEAIELIRTGRMKSISKSFAEMLIAKHGGDSTPRHDRKVLAAVHCLQNRLAESHGQLRPETLDQLADEFASAQAQLNEARFSSVKAIREDSGEPARPTAFEGDGTSLDASRVTSMNDAQPVQILPRQSPTMPQQSEILPRQDEILPRQFFPYPQKTYMSESVEFCETCG